MAKRPVRIIGDADRVMQDRQIRPGHRAVVMLDVDLTTTALVIAAVDEIAILRAVCAR